MNRTIEKTVDFHVRGRGQGQARSSADVAEPVEPQVPHLARLMALAIRCDALVRSGEIKDYAELADLAHVSRPRITQVMNLCLLSPDIQEQILYLEAHPRGRGAILLSDLQFLAAIPDWVKQRRRWRELQRSRGDGSRILA
jgi:hypothetical protein